MHARLRVNFRYPSTPSRSGEAPRFLAAGGLAPKNQNALEPAHGLSETSGDRSRAPSLVIETDDQHCRAYCRDAATRGGIERAAGHEVAVAAPSPLIREADTLWSETR
jgi:hypothetical protein